VICFAPGQMLELPLVSASRGNRTAIYLLPSTPGAPVQATQFTDDFETNSEESIDVATVSVWSHEGSHLAIGYSSGKISIWQRQ
jgi:cell wall assembly regulator SMI1